MRRQQGQLIRAEFAFAMELVCGNSAWNLLARRSAAAPWFCAFFSPARLQSARPTPHAKSRCISPLTSRFCCLENSIKPLEEVCPRTHSNIRHVKPYMTCQFREGACKAPAKWARFLLLKEHVSQKAFIISITLYLYFVPHSKLLSL